MSRCPHEHLSITEIGKWTTEHTLEDGEWSHNNEPAGYGPTLYVECYQCGLEGNYSRYKLPKWLQARLDSAINH